ncbi:hypothetical protein [Methanotorris formicicus]|uniref:hypothetical protein n=1 Tax=Methanotorris formicicus TaxID=213185 RepID=UPI003A4E4639
MYKKWIDKGLSILIKMACSNCPSRESCSIFLKQKSEKKQLGEHGINGTKNHKIRFK